MDDMNSHYRVVVIGGGVVGTSVLYHLAKFGWTDVCLLERSVLTAGSSWHAAGGIHALNADPNMAALQAYTIDLLSEIQEESGQNIGLHMTGGLTMAGTPERWEWLQSAYRVFQSIGIEDCELVTPEEAQKRSPIMSTEGLLGGMWADREGYIDTTGTVLAYAVAAKKNGATVIEHNRVLELNQTAEGCPPEGSGLFEGMGARYVSTVERVLSDYKPSVIVANMGLHYDTRNRGKLEKDGVYEAGLELLLTI